MFAAANQTHFSLAIDGLALDLQVLSFSGREAISQPFAFDLELVGERPVPDLESLLHKPAFLTLGPAGNGIHGLVRSAGQGDSGKRLTRYRITLVPQLAYLAQRTNQRIFQHLTVPQIVGRVLEEHGILADAYRFQLGTRYPEREYCVQYDERPAVRPAPVLRGGHPFSFPAQRHGAPAGIRRRPDGVPAARAGGLPAGLGLVADRPAVKRFGVRLETRTNRVTRRDYDFETAPDAGKRRPRRSPAGPRGLRLSRSLRRPRARSTWPGAPSNGSAATTAWPRAAATNRCCSAATSCRWLPIPRRAGTTSGCSPR